MRASSPGGRFTIQSEIDRYWAGISEDLQRDAGGSVPWRRYSEADTTVDDVYDTGGRSWSRPVTLPYITAQVHQGKTSQNERGFYNTDQLRLVVSVADFIRVFPNTVPEVDAFLRDRVTFNGKVFRPERMFLRGLVANRYTLVTMDLIEVMEDESVDDLS